MKTVLFCLLIILVASCEEPEHIVKANGIVRNWSTKQPIEGAVVGIQDWLAAGWLRDTLKATPGRYFEAITDANGNFEISIRTKNPVFLWAGKDGKKWYKFDPDFSDGIYVGMKGLHVGENSGLILELQSHTTFNPLFQKRANALDTDTIHISVGSYQRPFSIEEGPRTFVGKGPFYYAGDLDREWLYTVGDRFIPFKIKQEIDGVWIEKLDSVYVPGQINYNETIYY